MKLVIKDGMVIASHANNQDIENLYNDLEIVRVHDDIKLQIPTQSIPIDLNNPASAVLSTNLPSDPRLSWDLEESKKNALSVLEDIAEEYRVKILSIMPGRIAGYEAKAKIASRIIESNSPNQADMDFLKLEADSRGITVPELAAIILKRAEEFANISTYMDGESQRIKTLITNAETTKEVWDFMKIFEENIINKIGD